MSLTVVSHICLFIGNRLIGGPAFVTRSDCIVEHFQKIPFLIKINWCRFEQQKKVILQIGFHLILYLSSRYKNTSSIIYSKEVLIVNLNKLGTPYRPQNVSFVNP